MPPKPAEEFFSLLGDRICEVDCLMVEFQLVEHESHLWPASIKEIQFPILRVVATRQPAENGPGMASAISPARNRELIPDGSVGPVNLVTVRRHDSREIRSSCDNEIRCTDESTGSIPGE